MIYVKDRDFGRNAAIIISSIYVVYQKLPKKIIIIFWLLLNFVAIILTIISSLTDYSKPKLSDLVNSINWTHTIFFALGTLFLLLFISVLSCFSKYIMESDYRVNFISMQASQRPLLLNENIKRDFITEIENCCFLKKNIKMAEEYFYVLGINLVDETIIEIVAKNKTFPVYERMIFELFRKKHLDDTYVYDPEGLTVVCRRSPESFTSILIDTYPRDSQWQETIKELKNTKSIKPNDLYLKVYIPTIVKHSTDESLTQILEGLKRI